MGSIAACPIAPELSTPGGPHLSLPCCQSWGQSLSPLPTNSGKRAANLYPSVLPQQRCSTTQWVPSAVGDTECRRDWGSLVFSSSKQRTDRIASRRTPKWIDKLRRLWSWCCCYWWGCWNFYLNVYFSPIIILSSAGIFFKTQAGNSFLWSTLWASPVAQW